MKKFHVAVATAEMQYQPPLLIHFLVSINVEQVLMNVSGCHFFHMKEFSDTPLLFMHFHVRHHFVRLPLPLCYHLSHGNKTQWNIARKV